VAKNLRILVVARHVPEHDKLDLIGLPEEGRRRGHEVVAVCSSEIDERTLEGLRYDAIVCRFSGEVRPAEAVRAARRSGTPVIGGDNGRWLGDNQIRTLRALRLAEIPTPSWRWVSSAAEAESTAKQIGYPVVVKHPGTMGGGGVRLAHNGQELAEFLDEFGAERTVLQHFIAESAGTDVRIVVVGGRAVGSIRRTAREGDFRANLFLGGTAAPYDATPEELNLAIAAADAIGLDVAGIDILQSMYGPLVVEVNHNPGVTGISGAARAIVDLVEARVRDGKRE
jgi:ribosomal protein S6--L-glutamate ligase